MSEHATSTTPICRVRGGPVVHELIEGEIIVINLDSGDYFSLTGLAAELWQLMLEPAPLSSLVQLVAAQPEASPEAAGYTAATFVRHLLEHGLILVDQASALPQPLPPSGLPASLAAVVELQRFSDVAELLKLDPVHEVDEVGWPVKAKDEPAVTTGDGAL
jgi:hypothetical protein